MLTLTLHIQAEIIVSKETRIIISKYIEEQI